MALAGGSSNANVELVHVVQQLLAQLYSDDISEEQAAITLATMAAKISSASAVHGPVASAVHGPVAEQAPTAADWALPCFVMNDENKLMRLIKRYLHKILLHCCHEGSFLSLIVLFHWPFTRTPGQHKSETLPAA